MKCLLVLTIGMVCLQADVQALSDVNVPSAASSLILDDQAETGQRSTSEPLLESGRDSGGATSESWSRTERSVQINTWPRWDANWSQREQPAQAGYGGGYDYSTPYYNSVDPGVSYNSLSPYYYNYYNYSPYYNYYNAPPYASRFYYNGYSYPSYKPNINYGRPGYSNYYRR